MPDCKPSDILLGIDHEELTPPTEVATDTETSGLFADDGARTSTASVAWVDIHGGWREWAERFDNVTYGREEIAPGLEVDIVSIAWPFDQGVEGKPEDTGQGMLWAEADNLDQIEWERLLEFLNRYPLVMHNSKFDSEKYRVGVRRWPGIGEELQDGVVWDTQNVNALLWPLEPTSLKPTCARIFGRQWADEAGEVKKYLQKSKLPAGRWDLMPWSVIGKYADTDARITLMLKLRQEWEIAAGNVGAWLRDMEADNPNKPLIEAIERRLATTNVLYKIERRGIPYDEVTSREAAILCRERAEELGKGLPFGPTGEKAKKFFFQEGLTDKKVECLNLVPYSVTDKGSPSLTAEIVQRMINDEVPYAKEWGEYSKASNAASMWYEGYADAVGPDGRIRCAFRQNGTRSSRFSVERINLQAIPQNYRLSNHSVLDGILTPRQIIANAVPDGWRLYELDLEQAELRVGAMFAECRKMLDMIHNGADLHTYTTRELWPEIEFEGPQWEQYRQVGKRGNFSLQFGSGGATFKAMVSKETGIILSDSEANGIVRDWNALYPEYRVAISKHMHKVEKRQQRYGHGWVEFINGERRWFQTYEEAHKAFNQRVQGNLAQFGIDWLLETEAFLGNHRELTKRANRDEIGEPGLVMLVHDSQMLLLPDDEFGRDLADQCAQFGRDLWAKKWFPGVPGGVDYHSWDKVAVG